MASRWDIYRIRIQGIRSCFGVCVWGGALRKDVLVEMRGASEPLSLTRPPGSLILLSPSQANRDEAPPTRGLRIAFQRTTCFWTPRRRGRSTCLTTVASSSEAWRSTSGPRAGTTGRSSGAQPEGVDQGWVVGQPGRLLSPHLLLRKGKRADYKGR